MEENKKIWNKKMDELTVSDVIIVNFAVPAIAVGGVVAVGAVMSGINLAKTKFQTLRSSRKTSVEQ